jgi:hypothetical protein
MNLEEEFGEREEHQGVRGERKLEEGDQAVAVLFLFPWPASTSPQSWPTALSTLTFQPLILYILTYPLLNV